MQSLDSGTNGGVLNREQPHKSTWNGPAKRSAESHDGSDQHKPCVVDLQDTFMFSGAIVVTDQRTHSLNDPIRRQIQEGLQLVVNPKNKNIGL